MAYPYYNNNQFYMQDLQNMREKIDRQMQQMQQLNQQQQQPIPQVTQNFSIAPTQNNTSELEAKYVNNIDEVKNTFVMKTGVFINKDFTTLWIKNTNGDIKTYTLEEVIETDPRDIEINNLKQELQRMREMISYDNKSDVDNSNDDGADESKNAKKLPSRTKSNAK